MSKMRHVLTSESVSEGHPDKVCDQISDAILDECLLQDPESRVACETLATTNLIVLAGEITTKANVDWEKTARQVVADIGYTDSATQFSADDAEVIVRLHKQSPDIAQGVDRDGAGDQGMMFGFACNETDGFMPAPIYYAHRIVERFAKLRHSGDAKYAFLRPDSKSQVSFIYEGTKPVAIDTVVLSHQHTPGADMDYLAQLTKDVVKEVIPAAYLNDDIKYFVNPTGNFEIGGPNGDTGLTGRKIIVDSYGGIGRHGGGAFSGKDPSKVDRSAAYMARYVAKNIVAAGLADRCEIQVAYAIGVAKPVSLFVDTFGTGKIADSTLAEQLMDGSIFDFRPKSIIATLGLKHPDTWRYRQSAAYGHFGRSEFPWEKLDKAEELARLI